MFTDTAKSAAGKLPTRAISGRWGSIHSAERFLLNAGYDETSKVLPEVLDHGPARKAAAKKAAAKATKKLAAHGSDGDASDDDEADAAKQPGLYPKKAHNEDEVEHCFALVLDETKHYQEQRGRWIAATLRNVVSAEFWSMHMRAHVSRWPLMHAMFFLQSPRVANPISNGATS